MEMSRREYLGIYIIKKPRTPEERKYQCRKAETSR